MERYELPEGWEWKRLSDPEVCLLNPKKSELKNLSDSTLVTFVPMAAVDEVSGTIAKPEVRRLDEVRKGYTYFAEGDVLFAKITPCMENGKSAIARKLTNGVGFGSTEFHVFRPLTQMIPEWLHMLVRSKIVRDEAKNSMCGAAGQQRVPIEFFKELEIPIPPLPEQRRIVKRIEELTRRVEEAQKLIREAMQDISSLNPSLLDHLFQMAEARNWRKVELGEISTIIMGQSPKGSSYNLNGRGAPLLNGPTEFGPEHPTPVQWTTEPTRLCEEGDILFCVRGSTTGRMNWADQQYCLGRGLAAIRPHQDKCPPGFVYAFVQTQAAAILHQGEGGVFPNFNRDQLTSMEIPLPPIDEQRHVVEYLNKCQTKARELEQLQAETEAELAAFTPALLAKAFRGEL